MAEELSFYDLKARKKFKTDKYKVVIRKMERFIRIRFKIFKE